MNEECETQVAFTELALDEAVLRAVREAGYEAPTDIQAQIIPHVSEGRDVLAQSQTGSGKTAAFALPILSKLDMSRRAPQTLVLAPTRELAIQVAKSFVKYGRGLGGLSVATIYGGQDYEIQFRQLRRGPQVVVGTPGRVIDHIKRGTLDLGTINCLVLDEADEMLNMGFLEDVELVLERVPKPRQIALFSATMPAPIRDVAKRYLDDPVWVRVESDTLTAASIRQRAVLVPNHARVSVLVRLLETEDTDGVIVFTRTKESTGVVADALQREGIAAAALNGDMPQRARERTIDKLKSGQLDVLVATDVAARGLDVTRVSHVFNFDAPRDTQAYVHRIGRTGRAGREGEAILFLAKSQRTKLRSIERVTGQPIEVMRSPTSSDVNAKRVDRFKAQIGEMIQTQDLSTFERLVTEYAESTGAPLETIAAAIAQLGQRGRPFFVEPDGRRPNRDDHRETSGPRALGRWSREEAEGEERRGRRDDRGGRDTRDARGRDDRPTRDAQGSRGRDDRPTRDDQDTRGRGDRAWRDDRDTRGRRDERARPDQRGGQSADARVARDERTWRDRGDRPQGGDRDSRWRRERDDARSFGDRDARPDRSPRRERGERSADGMERYRLDVGHDDGVRPENIVGAVANEGGLEGSMIGAIRIHGDHSTIELPEGMSRDTYRKLRRTWVAGKPLGLTRTADDGRELPPCHQDVDEGSEEPARPAKRGFDRRRPARSGGWAPPRRKPRQFGS